MGEQEIQEVHEGLSGILNVTAFSGGLSIGEDGPSEEDGHDLLVVDVTKYHRTIELHGKCFGQSFRLNCVGEDTGITDALVNDISLSSKKYIGILRENETGLVVGQVALPRELIGKILALLNRNSKPALKLGLFFDIFELPKSETGQSALGLRDLTIESSESPDGARSSLHSKKKDEFDRTFSNSDEMFEYHEEIERTTTPASLATYKSLCAGLVRPTADQIDNFVQHVCEAHSWYKHLPFLPPGKPFFFYLSPTAGFHVKYGPLGKVKVRDITNDSDNPGLMKGHNSIMNTDRYRSRFGFLTYSGAELHHRVAQAKVASMPSYCHLPFMATPDIGFRIPKEIADLGCVELTGAIHSLAYIAPKHAYGRDQKYLLGHGKREWPEETGGSFTRKKLEKIARSEPYKGMDEDLTAVIQPEKDRLKGLIGDAIGRAINAVFE